MLLAVTLLISASACRVWKKQMQKNKRFINLKSTSKAWENRDLLLQSSNEYLCVKFIFGISNWHIDFWIVLSSTIRVSYSIDLNEWKPIFTLYIYKEKKNKKSVSFFSSSNSKYLKYFHRVNFICQMIPHFNPFDWGYRKRSFCLIGGITELQHILTLSNL